MDVWVQIYERKLNRPIAFSLFQGSFLLLSFPVVMVSGAQALQILADDFGRFVGLLLKFGQPLRVFGQ